MFKNTNLSDKEKIELAKISNHGLAQSTWGNYKTARNMIEKCQKEKNQIFIWPISENDILIFISWLLTERKLSSSTVENYLAGVRQIHIMKGIQVPNFRTDLVKTVLKGQQNFDKGNKLSTKFKRLPATINIMKLLKEEIRCWDKDPELKLLVWTVCTVMFHGVLRGGEILSKHESTFDPNHTLLTKDVKINRTEHGKIIEITLKNPKESGNITVVDIFESGGPLCPVKALLKWESINKPDTNLPMFRNKAGTPLTASKLNGYLKELLGKHLTDGQITTHSFRIGIASILGSKGFSDSEIKLAGRWSSRAFQAYLRLPRTQRAEIAKKIGTL